MHFPAKPWAVTAHPRPRAANTEGRDGARESSGRAGSEQRGLSSAVAFPSRASWRPRDPSSCRFTLLLLPQSRALLSGWNQGRGATRGGNSGTATAAPGAIPVAAGGTARPHRDIPARGEGTHEVAKASTSTGATSRAPARSPCAPQPQSTAVTPRSAVSPFPGTPPATRGQRTSEGTKGQRDKTPPCSHLIPCSCRLPWSWTDSQKSRRGVAAIIHV